LFWLRFSMTTGSKGSSLSLPMEASQSSRV
jgi:hypothetical protein